MNTGSTGKVPVIDTVQQNEECQKEQQKALKRIQGFTEVVARQMRFAWECDVRYGYSGPYLMGSWRFRKGFLSHPQIAYFDYKGRSWAHKDIMEILEVSPLVINFSTKYRDQLNAFTKTVEKVAEEYKISVEIHIVNF